MRNAVKHAAATGDRIRGVHMTYGETAIIEVMAKTGIDFVYLDGEHGAFNPRDFEACSIAAERHGLTVIARVPDTSESTIVSFLDRGVKGVVVPHVNSIEDAKAVVAATYYAPLGQRSFGGSRPHYGYGLADQVAHLAEANDTTSVCIMLESRSALEAAGEIAALPGVDYLSFGLHDLSQSLGVAGQPGHERVKAAVEKARAEIHQAGKRVREDFMRFAWINDIILAGARQLLG